MATPADPALATTMVGMTRLEQIHTALCTCEREGITGEFLEAGVWRGGASIFAAAVIKRYGMGRHVWVADSFEGFSSEQEEELNWARDQYDAMAVVREPYTLT